MRGISWRGAGNAAVVIRSHLFAGRANPRTILSWPVSLRGVRRGGLSMLAVVVVVVSAQSAVLASSSAALDWTKQAPAASPPARANASMAYDAATGNAVLFGGSGRSHHHHGFFGDTWTWDGLTWTKQAPAAHPSARFGASMAYDKATGDTVLFGGGDGVHLFSGTWTWDGSTWTKQAPAAHPSARQSASMAYDAATGNIVLFGGSGYSGWFSDTWTWGGSG